MMHDEQSGPGPAVLEVLYLPVLGAPLVGTCGRLFGSRRSVDSSRTYMLLAGLDPANSRST